MDANDHTPQELACIRQEWVYYAWGLVVLLVVLGFTAMPPLLLDVIYIFHYPLLFFMAGYFCRLSAQSTRSTSWVPVMLVAAYLALALFNALFLQVLQQVGWLPTSVTLTDSLAGTLYGTVAGDGLAHAEPLWVLPVLALVLSLDILIERLVMGNGLLVASLVSGALAWLFARLNVGVLPWGLHALPLAASFFMLGRWLVSRCYLRFALRPVVANLVMYAFAGVVYLMASLGGRMSPQSGHYGGSILYLMGGSLAGVLAAYFRAIAVLQVKPLRWMGERWIALIGLSFLPVRVLSEPFTLAYERFSVSVWLQPFGAMSQALIAIALAGALLALLERVWPRFSGWLAVLKPECSST